jgi:hypothetical protein
VSGGASGGRGFEFWNQKPAHVLIHLKYSAHEAQVSLLTTQQVPSTWTTATTTTSSCLVYLWMRPHSHSHSHCDSHSAHQRQRSQNPTSAPGGRGRMPFGVHLDVIMQLHPWPIWRYFFAPQVPPAPRSGGVLK